MCLLMVDFGLTQYHFYVIPAPPQREGPIKFMVPVDASANAVKAFHYAARLLNKGDEIILFHVTNPGRYPDMSANFHPDSIKASFETEAIKADINMTHKMEFVCEEKHEGGKRIREMIRDYAEHHADVVVLGSFGAKLEAKGQPPPPTARRARTLATSPASCVLNSAKARPHPRPAQPPLTPPFPGKARNRPTSEQLVPRPRP